MPIAIPGLRVPLDALSTNAFETPAPEPAQTPAPAIDPAKLQGLVRALEAFKVVLDQAIAPEPGSDRDRLERGMGLR